MPKTLAEIRRESAYPHEFDDAVKVLSVSYTRVVMKYNNLEIN